MANGLAFYNSVAVAGLHGRLTVKLRGRTGAPAPGAEGAQFLSARGANPEAHHGPLQRLLEVSRGTGLTFGSLI